MAKRHPSSRRRPSEAPSEPDDVFVAKVYEITAWAKHNSQAFIFIGLALALVLGGGLYYYNYRANLNAQAMANLERVHQTLSANDVEGAQAQLVSFLEQFSGSRHGEEGRLLLGQVYLADDQPELAIRTLSEAPALRHPLGAQLRMLLARAYEEVGRLDEAAVQYLEVAEGAPMDFQQREALGDAARVRSQAGNHNGAAELYRRILDGLDDDVTPDERGLYELRLEEAQHAARD